MNKPKRQTIMILIAFIIWVNACRQLPENTPVEHGEGPFLPIHDITTNLEAYPNQQIPQFEKLEITFQVDTTAVNPQLPYDATPPAGIEPEIGISVDALFTPDNWKTVFFQPGFYYQDFLQELRSGEEWVYPTTKYAWKVRFTPDFPGEWQGKLVMVDANGRFESAPFPFTVMPSDNPGFIRVSEQDSRYFEFEDGTYFPGLGMNLELPANLNQLSILQENGIQLIRTYLPSQYAIWGGAWSPWRVVGSTEQGQETNAHLRHDASPGLNLIGDSAIAVPGHDLFLWLSHDETIFDDGQQRRHIPCAVLGWNTPPIPVQPQTDYRLRVRFRTDGLTGPKLPDLPFGLTVKTAQWLWHRQDETQRCTYPGSGNLLVASYVDDTFIVSPDLLYEGWLTMESIFNSGDSDFLPRLWLAIENATAGSAFIDEVWIEPVTGDGITGANVIYKASMANHLYFDQRSSFAFDQALAAAELHDIFLKLVVMEKGDVALNSFGADGSLRNPQPARGEERPFYGTGRTVTKIRWLQQAWWRYLQARWGYSTAIHSWELINEGSPTSEAHYILADEFGKYFQTQFIPDGQNTQHPNLHLITTSFWNGFPKQFWNSEAYPYVDYADVHHYARPSVVDPFPQVYTVNDFYDAAQFSVKLSEVLQTRSEMPIVRGELGFIFTGDDLFNANVSDGVWLHNLLWSGINAGGMMELYWTGAPTQSHIVSDTHDHRSIFASYYHFIKDVPLNNGRYTNASPASSTPELRAWGQQDVDIAHLWIQNANHTWWNLAQGNVIPPVTGTITLSHFQPGAEYTLTWWDTYQSSLDLMIITTETVRAAADGSLILMIEALEQDTAVAISPSN